MLIDWFTVGAQVLNFLILVWLLKRFLYHPILDAIDARERRIAAELADADATRASAEKERDRFQRQNEDLARQRGELLRQATRDANAERQRLIDEARADAASLSAKRQQKLDAEARRLQQALARRAQQEVFAITRKTLVDLTDASLEGRMVQVLARRLRDLGDADKAALSSIFKTSPAPLTVRSAFALPPAERAALQDAIEETFGAGISLRFEAAPELIGGIEITTDGQKLAWSITDYLASLQAGVDEVLTEKARTVTAIAPETGNAGPVSAGPTHVG